MKKTMFFIFNIVLVLSLSLPARAEEGYRPNFDVQSKAVYLYNLDTETLIYQKNQDTPLPPASLTKIMTCILALENTADLDNEIVVYPASVQDWLYRYQYIEGNGVVSNAGLLAGEELTMRQAIYAMMLPSANEVAMSVADHIAGSQEAFTEMMNTRAKELGAKNTNFANPNGLHLDEHYTTAYDMAQITRHAMTLPGFMDIVSTTSYDCPPTNLHPDGIYWPSTIQMMVKESSYYYPGLKGVKTGTVPEAGRCFISTATKDGFTYLLVIMGAPIYDEEGNTLPQQMAFVETANMYDWVFDVFRVKTLIDKGVHAAEVPLNLSLEQDFVKLMTTDRFTALIPKDIEASSVVTRAETPESLDAPVSKGDPAGELVLILSGEEIGRVPLVVATDVEASQALTLLEQGKAILSSFWFKFAIVFIVLLFIFYIFLMVLRNKRRKQSSYRPRRRL